MKFTLTIKMGNDAMNSARDLSAAVSKVAHSILRYEADVDEDGFKGKVIVSNVLDENGNKVGRWEIT